MVAWNTICGEGEDYIWKLGAMSFGDSEMGVNGVLT